MHVASCVVKLNIHNMLLNLFVYPWHALVVRDAMKKNVDSKHMNCTDHSMVSCECDVTIKVGQ